MKHIKQSIIATTVAVAALLASMAHADGYPIVIPASTADNGSRSVVSINQGEIESQISNAVGISQTPGLFGRLRLPDRYVGEGHGGISQLEVARL